MVLLIGGISLISNEKFIKEWEEERKKGKFKYILTHTIRYFIIVFLCVVVISILGVVFVSIYTGTNALYILNIQVIKKILMRFSAILIAFIFSSYLEWNGNEKEYNKLLVVR